jgi:TolB protein
VEAPFPQLNALTIEPYYALRNRVTVEAGWDVLSSLENAFVPITQPLEPGRERDWLYTGRSFTLPTILLDVGWMAVVKEEYTGATYWRVYIRSRVQDGSLGRPLLQLPWDFNARFTGSSTYYEQGGAPLGSIPEGYWIDLTALAIEYGWERLPALSNWRSVFYTARFNQFVITSGLDWEQAILQLYPPEILTTPGAVTR